MLGRPVKICLTREEVFYQHRGRHPVLMKFRTGVSKDGKLTAMHLQTLLDGGAYGSHGPASTFYTGVLTPVTYRLPRFKFEACRVFTNRITSYNVCYTKLLRVESAASASRTDEKISNTRLKRLIWKISATTGCMPAITMRPPWALACLAARTKQRSPADA